MKSIIRKILKEEEDNARALNSFEIHLFKILNKDNAIDFGNEKLTKKIKDVLETLGKRDINVKYYLALYKSNYREAGDYQNITNQDLVDPRKFSQEKITNKDSSSFAKDKMPFKGSNLTGRWLKDGKGVEYYVVTSYDWYPVFLFKGDRWYEVIDTYSSTTRKQMRNANPIIYNSELGKNTIQVTASEMKQLERGATYEDIMKGKVEKLVADKGSVINQKSQFSIDYGRNMPIAAEPVKIKFKIEDVKQENDKAIVYVLIEDAGKAEGRKLIPSKGGYLRNEIPGANKERVEERVKFEILQKLKEYVGPWVSPWDKLDLSKTNIDFKFKHTHETI